MTDSKLLAQENAVLKRQLAERSRSLAEAEARYDAVFNSALNLMCLCTVDGIVLDVNRTTLLAAGLQIEDFVGKHLWETPWFARHPGEAQRLETALKTRPGQYLDYEMRILSKTGRQRSFQCIVRPFRSQVGGDARFLVVEGRMLSYEETAPRPRPAPVS